MNNLNRKSFDIFNKNHKIFIEGHRGVNREKPQNTKTSFLKAIEYQLDSIELDIWLSKDKIPVVLFADGRKFFVMIDMIITPGMQSHQQRAGIIPFRRPKHGGLTGTVDLAVIKYFPDH